VSCLFLAGRFCAGEPACAQRDLAFEHKSMQWMQMTRQVDEAIKTGKLTEAESLLKSIIADRLNYNLDLSAERSSLARVYAAMGRTADCEALLKINLRTREDEDGVQGYTVLFPLNEYADFLDRQGRKPEAALFRNRAYAIELAANKQGAELEKKQKQAHLKAGKHRRRH
jgi:hypothetical protein